MSGGIDRPWNDVLSFWFPEGHDLNIAPDRHRAYWRWRLHGGADAEIIGRFADVTERAATGQLDHWTGCAAGRLALIILLDQFSRSLWRDTPRAFAQDKAALALALEGLANGAYDAMPTPWHRITFTQPLGHAEGPDHLARIDRLIALRETVAASAPLPLQPIYQTLVQQARKVRDIIARFGRHPHRDAILGRGPLSAEKADPTTATSPHLDLFQEP